jgi:hypothetical protein
VLQDQELCSGQHLFQYLLVSYASNLFQLSLQDRIKFPLSRRCQLQYIMRRTLQLLHQDLERPVVPSLEDPMSLRQMNLLETPHKRLSWISWAISSSFTFFVWSCRCGCDHLNSSCAECIVGCICIEPERPSFGHGGTSMRKVAVACSSLSSHQ